MEKQKIKPQPLDIIKLFSSLDLITMENLAKTLEM